jgi:hypothetical protein
LQGYTDEALLATWRSTARALAEAKVQYASEYLRAKIRGESDGTAHQIATETTKAAVVQGEADLKIIEAIWYARGRKDPLA